MGAVAGLDAGEGSAGGFGAELAGVEDGVAEGWEASIRSVDFPPPEVATGLIGSEVKRSARASFGATKCGSSASGLRGTPVALVVARRFPGGRGAGGGHMACGVEGRNGRVTSALKRFLAFCLRSRSTP